jgi:beta-1,4-mannosyltransferase
MFETPTHQTSFLRTIALNSIRAIVKTYERILAPLADAHLTVTHAMEVWLGEHFNVHGTNVRVLYDKPPMLFRPTTIDEEHELFQRLDLEGENEQLHGWLYRDNNDDDDVHNEQIPSEETLFTQCILHNSKPIIQPRQNRPALLVSSTSWTPDEDFSVLLEALEKLHALITLECEVDASTSSSSSFPNILVVVTGKGPQKEYFLPLLHQFNKQHQYIKIITLWLEASDYPKLLGCATLGVCLHTSTSGLDLPMKVLDMFGCEVPVCAIGFDCLDELVKDGVNGRVFCNGEELSRQLFDLLKGYPLHDKELERYRQNIRGMTRWKENWDECAKHLIVGDCGND